MAGAAELILTADVIRTVDRDRPTARAMAVAGGRVLALGSVEEVLAFRGPNTEVQELGDRAVYPGFVDVHNHHAIAGTNDLYELSFSPTLGLEAILDRVREYALDQPEDAWIAGGSWASTLLEDLNTSTVGARLDEAAGGRPVVLSDDSHHNRWANTAAMRLAEITRDTVPADGVTLLDAADGEPSGILLEAVGIQVAKAHGNAGALSVEQHRRASQRGVEMLNAYGITAFQDAAVSLKMLTALRSLDEASELNARVVSSMTVNDQILGFDPVGEPLLARGEEFRTVHHRPDFVKIFLDGVPPARTALFLEPYLPDEAHGARYHGDATMTFDELYRWLRQVAGHDLGAKVHCTGDGAARLLFDVIERLGDEGFTDTAFQIAHGQFLADDDIVRMVRLAVSADISPFLWFPGVIGDALAAVLGEDRAAKAQPNRAIIDAGGLVAGGSDWPVSESPNPFEGIQGLITRADPHVRAGGTLGPEQAIGAQEALEVCTINGARQWAWARTPVASRPPNPPTSSSWIETLSPGRQRQSSIPRFSRRGSPAVGSAPPTTEHETFGGAPAVSGAQLRAGLPADDLAVDSLPTDNLRDGDGLESLDAEL